MSTVVIQRSLTPDVIEIEGAEGRTLHARLMRWNVPSSVTDGGPWYEELWRRGSFSQSIKRAQAIGRGWPLMYNHDEKGMPVGMVTAVHERDDGPWATAKVSRTAAGNDIVELVRDGALPGVSVRGIAMKSRKNLDGVVERVEFALQEISVTPWPSLVGSDELVLRNQREEQPTVPGSLAEMQAFLDTIKS